MDLSFVSLAEWEALAERRVAVKEQRIAVKDAAGREVLAISPGLGVHRELTVLGHDWLPVRPDGTSVLEQMAHNPAQFLSKVRNVETQGEHHRMRVESERRIDGKAVLVGDSANYYHWLIDHLPRLLMARAYGELEGARVLVGPQLPRFAEDSLALLGLGEDRRIIVQPREAVRIAEVCVPNMLAATTVCHPVVPPLVRKAFAVTRGRPGRRIYLSRQDAATRRLANEDALIALLERHGFERYMPSALGLAEQVRACQDAQVVVAVHGAALANMLFCSPGSRVIEIFSPAHPASFFVLLARVCRLQHAFVPAQLVDARADLSPLHHAEWEVDLAAMGAALAALPDPGRGD